MPDPPYDGRPIAKGPNGPLVDKETQLLKLRLARMGRKKRPSYRVVVQEHTAARDGSFLEILGHYDPLQEPAVFEVDSERVQHWLSKGAQPTVTVHRFLHKQGLIDEYVPKPRSKRADAKREAAQATSSDDAAAPAAESAEAPADDTEAPAAGAGNGDTEAEAAE